MFNFSESKIFRNSFFYIFLCCLPTFLILSAMILRTPFFIRTDEKRWFEMALSLLSFKYECDGHICVWHPPMYPASISLFFLLFGIGILQARFTTVFYTLLYLILAYFFTKEIYGNDEKNKAILAVLLMGTLPGILLFGFMIYSNIAEAFFMALSILYFIKGVNTKKGINFLLWGVFLGLGVATKATAFQVLAYIILFILSTKQFEILKNKWFLAGNFVVLLTFIFWQIWISVNGATEKYTQSWLFYNLYTMFSIKNEDVVANTPVKLYALIKISPFAYIIWIPMIIGLVTAILTLLGVYTSLKNRYQLNQGRILLLVWIFGFLVAFSIFGIRAARHALPLAIPLTMFALKGLDNIKSRFNNKITPILISIIFLTNLIQFVLILPYLLVYR